MDQKLDVGNVRPLCWQLLDRSLLLVLRNGMFYPALLVVMHVM